MLETKEQCGYIADFIQIISSIQAIKMIIVM